MQFQIRSFSHQILKHKPGYVKPMYHRLTHILVKLFGLRFALLFFTYNLDIFNINYRLEIQNLNVKKIIFNKLKIFYVIENIS